jgi:hypothetical protein
MARLGIMEKTQRGLCTSRSSTKWCLAFLSRAAPKGAFAVQIAATLARGPSRKQGEGKFCAAAAVPKALSYETLNSFASLFVVLVGKLMPKRHGCLNK